VKITIELPECTACAFVNYVYVNEKGNMAMAVRSFGSEELEKLKGGESDARMLSRKTDRRRDNKPYNSK
jgi:hypothetical protein